MKPDFFNILAEHGLVDQAEAEAAAAGLSFKKGRVKASELAQALLATAPLDGPELIQLAASLAETEASKCPHLTHHAWFESVVAPHVIRQLSKGANGYARIAYELSDRLRRSKAVMEAVPARWRRRTH